MRNDPVGLALRIIDDAFDRVEAQMLRPDIAPLPDLSIDGAMARTTAGQQIVDRIAALDLDALPQALRLAVEVARGRAAYWAVQADWYWTVFDPVGGEMFGMFAPTPYCGGMAIAGASMGLARIPLGEDAGRYRYLAGLCDLGTMLDRFAARTRGQAERGIFMPRAQAEAAIALIDRLTREQTAKLAVGDARLAGQDAFKRDVDRIVAERVAGGFARIGAVLDPAYMGATRDDVGLAQYPDGSDIYVALVRLHGSTSLTPAEVHQSGLERMADIRTGMAQARAEAGFDGDDHAYRAHLDADPAWRADTPDAIGAFFQRYIDRFEPHVDTLFSTRPKATYGFKPLPDALTEAMTFGYYEPSTPERPHGSYVFNARNLAKSGLFNAGPLNYHELVPGHHLHLALQSENMALPAIRRYSLPTAYTEGWAEYAATLAGEVGMYALPAERFGRLVSEAFLACRLVVDTGMNALGWSLEQARDYMRQNSFMPETEIRSETLRYSCDIPGQALAYKLGDREMMRMRARMQAAYGERFELRDFHDAVLDVGALPLPQLDAHLDWTMQHRRHADTGER